MGIIGDDKRLDAAIISDTVNTASRIESLSKYFQSKILLSEACMEGLSDKSKFNVRYLGKVRVKGKSNMVRIYECFDGDEPEMIRERLLVNDVFHEGINAYTDKRFGDACLALREVMSRMPNDHVTRFFLQKSEQFMQDGVPEDWEGVENMVNK
jgi:hypothetical protein